MTQMTLANEYLGGHLGVNQCSAFIDAELSPIEVREISRHLTSCHSCALRVLSATHLKAATARAAHVTPPPEALARLTAQLHPRQPQRTAHIRWRFPVAWTAVAAALLLAVFLIGWRQIRPAKSLSAELLDQHLATLSSGASPEVISTDRHTVKPWFQGKLPFSFNLPENLPPDTTLKGADLAYLDGQPAALLLFTIHKHQVSIFLTQRSSSPVGAAPLAMQSGFVIERASTPDLGIIAVSDVNRADLDMLVSSLVGAQTLR